MFGVLFGDILIHDVLNCDPFLWRLSISEIIREESKFECFEVSL